MNIPGKVTVLHVIAVSITLFFTQFSFASENTNSEFEQKDYIADTTNHRVIISPTGFGVPKGKTLAVGYAAFVWNINYGLTEHIQLGLWTNIPVGIIAFVPSVKVHTDIGNNFAVAAEGFGGTIFPYTGWTDELLLLYGGNLSFSAATTDRKHILNLSLKVLSAGITGFDIDLTSGALITYSAGYRLRINEGWTFQLEALVPTIAAANEPYQTVGDGAIFLYGFRGHGRWIYGDIGFLLPMYEWFIEDVWKYVPFGIPYFSIGILF